MFSTQQYIRNTRHRLTRLVYRLSDTSDYMNFYKFFRRKSKFSEKNIVLYITERIFIFYLMLLSINIFKKNDFDELDKNKPHIEHY